MIKLLIYTCKWVEFVLNKNDSFKKLLSSLLK